MKIEINNFDIRHYSVLIKNSVSYRKLKKLFLVEGVSFVLVALLNVFVVFVCHSVNAFMILCLTIAFALFIVVGLRLRQSDPVKGYKKFLEKNPDYRLKAAFNDDKVVLEGHTAFSDTNSSYDYARIISAEEINGFFDIHLDSSGYIVFDGTEITEGTPEELRALLRAKLGQKYKAK